MAVLLADKNRVLITQAASCLKDIEMKINALPKGIGYLGPSKYIFWNGVT